MAAGVRETDTEYKRRAKQIVKERESVRILIWKERKEVCERKEKEE